MTRELSPTPWSRLTPVRQYCFEFLWFWLCGWTPKPLNFWRLLVLRLFGCKIEGKPFVHSRARFTHPWKVALHDQACLGDGAHAYALGPITIGERSTIAQEVYLCAGSHDFKDPGLPLVCKPIIIQEDVFVGARAMILPGVTLGKDAIIGAGSVVTKTIGAYTTAAGNPAKPL